MLYPESTVKAQTTIRAEYSLQFNKTLKYILFEKENKLLLMFDFLKTVSSPVMSK